MHITPEWQHPLSTERHLGGLSNFGVFLMELEADTVDAVAFVSYINISA